jgi:uncharacterized membrane protein
MVNLWWMLAGFLFIAISLPLIYQKVPPNRLYGFRVRKTLSNPRIWYAANRITGIDLLLTGILLVLTAALTTILSLFLPQSWLTALNYAVFMLALAATVIHSFWVLSKL